MSKKHLVNYTFQIECSNLIEKFIDFIPIVIKLLVNKTNTLIKQL
jgi:hypothetical protein